MEAGAKHQQNARKILIAMSILFQWPHRADEGIHVPL